MAAAPFDRLVEQMPIGGHLRGFQDERRIGRAICRLERSNGLHVARVGDNGGHGLQLVELGRHEWCLPEDHHAPDRGMGANGADSKPSPALAGEGGPRSGSDEGVCCCACLER